MALSKKIAFIGAGNMACALISYLISTNKYLPENIIATHHNRDILEGLRINFKIEITTSNIDAIKNSELIILCVRPQQFKNLINEIKPSINNHHIIVSIGIGVSIKWLHHELGNCQSIFHVHPPSVIFAQSTGISFITFDQKKESSTFEIIKEFFRNFGEVMVVTETEIEMYAIFSGCSPAFFCRLANDWLSLAIDNKIPQEVALKIIINSYNAIIHNVVDLRNTFDDFESKIATPNGVTEIGLQAIKKNGIKNMLLETIEKAMSKIQNIKNTYS